MMYRLKGETKWRPVRVGKSMFEFNLVMKLAAQGKVETLYFDTEAAYDPTLWEQMRNTDKQDRK
jgi:hypothetical protein